MPIAPRERLIVALDLSSVEAAEAMVARLGDAVSFYKIGYQLAFAGGLGYAQKLPAPASSVFLDLKLHDIGNTVAAGREKRRAPRRDFPHGSCLSADHAGRGRGARGRLAHSRRDGAHVV